MSARDDARRIVLEVLGDHARRLHAPTRPAALAELGERDPKLARRYATASRTLLSVQDEAYIRHHRLDGARYRVTPATLALLAVEACEVAPPAGWTVPVEQLYGLPISVAGNVDAERGYELLIVWGTQLDRSGRRIELLVPA